jgi:hypothetical protein
MGGMVEAKIEQQLQLIAANYDARRIQAEIAMRFLQLKHLRELFSLLTAYPDWEEKRLVLNFPNKFSTLLVRPLYRTIAAVLQSWDISQAILTWHGAGHTGFRIVASMGAGDSIFDVPPPFDLDVSITEALRLGDLIRGADNPMGCVLLDSDWQIWGNDALSVMCEKPLEDLVRTNVRANWVNRRTRTDDGLSAIKERLLREGDFVVSYCTKMSSDAVGKHDFESRFRLVLGGRCRLTEIYSYTPVT